MTGQGSAPDKRFSAEGGGDQPAEEQKIAPSIRYLVAGSLKRGGSVVRREKFRRPSRRRSLPRISGWVTVVARRQSKTQATKSLSIVPEISRQLSRVNGEKGWTRAGVLG